MKLLNTEKAIGTVLGHDITEIVPGKFKGVAFKKGHIIREEDIEKLLSIGKEHIYIFEMQEGDLHEDEAAIAIGRLICGEGIYFTNPKEGKINIKAKQKGLLKINRELLYSINNLGNICLATIHENRTIDKEDLIGGCRVIPLVVKKDIIDSVKNIINKKGYMINVKPFEPLKTALIITGSEVYKGKVEDGFAPIIEKKLKQFNTEIFYKTIVLDDINSIKNAVIHCKSIGAELIIVTGGMSVDPDDKTPGAIKATGANIISYGTPVLPGAMLLFGYLGEVPIFGLPGCVMFYKTTVFDLLLPRIMAGEKVEREDIIKMGYGGQCLGCNTCTFPDCHFGK